METIERHNISSSIVHSDPTYEAWKLARTWKDRKDYRKDSDPTYEAWKRKYVRTFYQRFGHSDPTYEAWKPLEGLKDQDETLYSDPTYEAWKPYSPGSSKAGTVSFRSYL